MFVHVFNDAGVKHLARIEYAIEQDFLAPNGAPLLHFGNHGRYTLEITGDAGPRVPRVFLRGKTAVVVASQDRAVTALRMREAASLLWWKAHSPSRRARGA